MTATVRKSKHKKEKGEIEKMTMEKTGPEKTAGKDVMEESMDKTTEQEMLRLV